MASWMVNENISPMDPIVDAFALEHGVLKWSSTLDAICIDKK